jgi:hypothetical protein
VFKSVTTITELEQLQLRLAELGLEVDELKQENDDQRNANSRYVRVAAMSAASIACCAITHVQAALTQHMCRSATPRAALHWTRSHPPHEHILTSGAPAARAVCLRLTCSMELMTKQLQEEVAYEQELRRQLADQLDQQTSKVSRLQGCHAAAGCSRAT